ncbi:MAG: hypothetical protein ACTTKL_10055 [Treponema sp.]
MIIAATFSKPSACCGAELGKDYLRVYASAGVKQFRRLENRCSLPAAK